MIISASRRTDIPAFFSEWFINRVRVGWCQVPNPLNYNQLSYVSLKPKDVEAIVFWSKNPEPLLKYLHELDERGFKYYFQFTLNDYPSIIEPNIPVRSERIETFYRVSEHLSPLHVIWRYDPIIISDQTNFDYHRKKFSEIARALKGCTRRVTISLVDYYKKTDRRFLELEREGFHFYREASSSDTIRSLLKDLSVIAENNGMEIFTCAEEHNYSEVGVRPGSCIDSELLYRLWSIEVQNKKDPTQRNSCLCNVSKDIGLNDTCSHGCSYCYSTRNIELAKRRYFEHDPKSPVIWGSFRELSEAEEADQQKVRLL